MRLCISDNRINTDNRNINGDDDDVEGIYIKGLLYIYIYYIYLNNNNNENNVLDYNPPKVNNIKY